MAVISSPRKKQNQGRVPFTRKTRKFWMENEMIHTVPFETFQKLYAIALIAAFFLFLLNFPIDTSTSSDFSSLRFDKLEH